MSFFDMTALRAILTTETDADSPLSEELMSQIRENLEALLILLAGTNITGSATANPPNNTTGYLTDYASAWTDDLHNGRTLLMTSGLAIGNMYTIDDTVASADRLVCTGDNLYADGVRYGDTYLILYDVKSNLDGHDHDGVNSKNINTVDSFYNTGSTLMHTGASAWIVKSTVRVYLPTYKTKVTMLAQLRIAGGGTGSVRLSSGAVTGTGQTTTSSTFVEKIIELDVSTLAGGLNEIDIELKTASSGDAVCLSEIVMYAE